MWTRVKCDGVRMDCEGKEKKKITFVYGIGMNVSTLSKCLTQLTVL